MKIIYLQEQIPERTRLQDDIEVLSQYIGDGEKVQHSVIRGKNKELCLRIERQEDNIYANSSYFVGIDWICENNLAVYVRPKMNNNFEIDYVKMLNDALCQSDNFEHLKDLVTIRFDKPSIYINQKYDILSIFLITEYINILHKIVKKGLKKSFYIVRNNLSNKVKGRILINRNIHLNLNKGNITNNYCQYQEYGINSIENQILKKALFFCNKKLEIYKHSIDISHLKKKISYINPYFETISDNINTKEIKVYKANPIYKDYYQAIDLAQNILKRYSYNISSLGTNLIPTPPFWIDMSKLFELYVYNLLKKVFTEKGEINYHTKAHYQELDYLLNPKEWGEPYIIDAKYKPRYKYLGGISIEDAREVSGYSRLSSIYKILGLDEVSATPIKCLIIYPDQDKKEEFEFNRFKEPTFDKVSGYVKLYKIGIKLPTIKKS